MHLVLLVRVGSVVNFLGDNDEGCELEISKQIETWSVILSVILPFLGGKYYR
jgi:hypothetical protein